jgi:hypothetical protein
MEDIHYQNQRLFCEKQNIPMFANQSCSHTYSGVQGELYGKRQTLGEMLVEKYGAEEAFKISAGNHIISCPGCGRSWCD